MTSRPDKGMTGPVRLARAFGSTGRGFRAAWREEEAFRQECLLALVVVPLGLWLGQTGVERALLVGPMFLVLVIELVNIAVEATVVSLRLRGPTPEMAASASLNATWSAKGSPRPCTATTSRLAPSAAPRGDGPRPR